ncbi:MAG TPA: hypothetical protein VKO86_09400 [Gemmatimonadales bacterium]|nr:hypothetical protein [Gemmatimonadales bacterium]
MSGEVNLEQGMALLVDLSRADRTTGGLEVGALLEAWGFVHGGPVDTQEPEQALFWIHPEHPQLHMTVPIGGPLPRFVVDYAAHLIRTLQTE